ncbi:MAG: tail fiber domain-containing protein [Bacteroidota bacterium]
MSVKSRIALKSSFQNGTVPTGADFAILIDSMLNMRDDHFFGKWQASRAYKNGDVVLHNKSIYQLVREEGANSDCEDGNNTEITLSPYYCSSLPPSEDENNWCPLELEVADNDWTVFLNESDDGLTEDQKLAQGIMLAAVYGKVGVGRNPEEYNAQNHPQLGGKFEVFDKKEGTVGQYIVAPEDTDSVDPTIQINRGEDDPLYVKNSVAEEKVNWITNTPIGFAFKKIGSEEVILRETASITEQTTDTDAAPSPLQLMLITSKGNCPQVGIGADNPEAMLDVKMGDQAQFLALNGQASTILLNLKSSSGQSYLAQQIDYDQSLFLTNASKGLHFGSAGNLEELKNGKGSYKHWMGIGRDGNVGIGTSDPSAKLEVFDNQEDNDPAGQFKMSFKNTNPAFSIVNMRPGSQNNYLTIGADNNQAVFLTDSDEGFYFGKGEDGTAEGKEEENVNQDNPKLLLSIKPDQKVGVAIEPTDGYELDVNGKLRTCGIFMDTNTDKIDKTEDLGEVMSKLLRLRPIKYKWNDNKPNASDLGEQIGLFAHEVEDYFPELVRKNTNDRKFSVAYPNMVAVLVKALQEQQETIKELIDRVVELERICADNKGA